MSEQFKTIVDIDSHKLFLFPEQLPTHKTKSKRTFLVGRLQYPDYWCSDWHREILSQNGHLPESKRYTREFDEKHCSRCFDALDDDDKNEYREQWESCDDKNDRDACECQQETFHFELLAVNPGIQTKKHVQDIESQFGSDLLWADCDIETKIGLLTDYGTFATLWQLSGVDETELTNAMVEQYNQTLTIGGFQLDAPQNAIGSSGWDFMKGDILGGLKK